MSLATWSELIDVAETGGVLPALTLRLRETGILASLDHDVRRRLDDTERMAAQVALANQRTFVQVARALTDADVPVVPYKGIDLANTVYTDMRMRPMTDVDLWVRNEDLPVAVDALANVGLVRKPSPDGNAPYPRAWDGEVKLRRRDDDHTVAELHLGPFPGEWLHRAAKIDRAAVWDRLTPGRLLGHPILRMSPEDHTLEVALHAAINSQFSYVPLRQLLDLVMLARAGLDAETLAQRAAEWRVTGPVRLAFTLAGEAYHDPSTETVSERLRANGPRHRSGCAYALPTLGDLVAARHLSSTRLMRYVYFLRLTHGWSDAARLLRLGLWPEPSWLLARYGSDGPTARLTHIGSLLSRDRRRAA